MKERKNHVSEEKTSSIDFEKESQRERERGEVGGERAGVHKIAYKSNKTIKSPEWIRLEAKYENNDYCCFRSNYSQ